MKLTARLELTYMFISTLFASIVYNQYRQNMGCVGATENDQNEIRLITIRLRKLKHEINLCIERVRSDAFGQQKVLVAEFKKPKSYRAMAAENAIANSIAICINKIHIYEIVKCHVEKILNYEAHFESNEKAKQSLYPSFKIILYSESILKDPNVSSACQFFRKRYPDIIEATDAEVKDEIMQYQKKSELASPSAINDYVLKLANQENLEVAEINKVGHNFRFGA